MLNIVFASWNPKKAAEIQRMAPEDIKIICLKDIPEAAGKPQAEENGNTFLENAGIKAKYWAEKLGMSVLAEDSGIMINALNGYPGVRTKRCLEDLCPGMDIDADNPDELYPALLNLMARSGSASTKAHWVSAMVLVVPNGTMEGSVIEAEESLTGEMCQCRGEKVFGFDQYFKPLGSKKTLSEMEPMEKDEVGPRKKAFEKILEQLI